MRANSRDVVKTHQSEVGVRVMEMTLLDVIHEYNRRFPSFTRCSTFFSLRIRHVKIVSSDATRLSITQEMMHLTTDSDCNLHFLLLAVCAFLRGMVRC